MKKIELERALLDPEGLKTLSARAGSIREKYGEGRSTPASKVRAAPHLPSQVRPTPDEAKANDLDHVEKRDLLAKVGRFMPELAKETPASALGVLTRRCRDEPSLAAQFLVEDAINRLILHGKPDSQSERVVEEAISVLGAAAEPAAESGAEGGQAAQDSIWTRLYRHADYEGASYFVNHPVGWVYRRIRQSSLDNANLNDRISSLYVDATHTEVGGKVILFQRDRYRGRYAIFPTTPGAPDERAWTPHVGDFINDRTSSILVVRQYDDELSFALGDLGLRDDIEDLVGDVPDISMRGDPIITWDMWPGFSPNRRYIYLRIPVEVEIDWWPDYDAEIRFWIYLYVNRRGSLRGYVDWYGAWVEGGLKTDSVLEGIMDALPDRLPDIQDRLDDALNLAALFEPFERQYFLPGTAASTGNTADDVTLVLVR